MKNVLRVGALIISLACVSGCPQPTDHYIYNATNETINIVSKEGSLRISARQSKSIPHNGRELDRTEDGFKKIRIIYQEKEYCYLTPYLGDLPSTGQPAIENMVFFHSGALLIDVDGRSDPRCKSESLCVRSMKPMEKCSKEGASQP